MTAAILVSVAVIVAVLTLAHIRYLVLLIVAMDIIYSIFVDLNSAIGHLLYIFYNRLVVGVLVVVLKTFGTQKDCNIIDRARYRRRFFAGETFDDTTNIFAVVLVCDATLWVAHLPRLNREIFARGLLVWRIHI